MLCVRINGRDVETTPVSLARMVFDGQVERSSPSRASGAESEQSLEQSLGSSHCEALTCELLLRLRSMYSLDVAAVDTQDLRRRVEDLCQWRWANPQVTARFFWAAGWLNDLADRSENAVRFYDAFLQMSTCDSLLRLLAYNNRGVLRIRFGRLEGVQDLARAAIPDRDSGDADGDVGAPAGRPATTTAHGRGRDAAPGRSPASGLPAACLNLLNLINVALGAENLRQAIDEELVDFLARLPDETRALWLGPSPRAGHPAETDGSILCAAGFQRLNRVTTRLAARARRLAPAESQDVAKWLSPAFFRPALSLWECRSDSAVPGPPDRTSRMAEAWRGPRAPVSSPAARAPDCTEAASLLLSDEIPSVLVRRESPLSRAEQFAHEELAEIESHLALNRYELARERLQTQRRILSSLNRGERFAGLLARVDAQLERITQLEAQKGRLEFQRSCARLIAEVEEFCRITDLCRAETVLHDLNLKLQELKAQSAQPDGGQAVGLLDELNARIARHRQRLERIEIRRRIRGPLRQVRENWPKDWMSPVSDSAYQAVALCYLNDPNGWVRNWSQLREQLDAHQGQYHLRAALTALQSQRVAWSRVEDDLTRALSLKPDLWLTAAPLFGLSCSAAPGATPQTRAAEHRALQAAAGRLFASLSQPAGQASEGRDSDPLGRASHLLERTFRAVAPDGQRALQLWRHVEATLSSLLTAGDPTAMTEAAALADRCLDHWPAGQATLPGPADPRHPVNLFLESCARARCLIQAEQLLNARPPRLEEAQSRYREFFDLGPGTRDQFRRAVTGLYLARFCREDAAPAQRGVLAALETWVETMAPAVRQGIRAQDVMRETETVRMAVVAQAVASATDRTPPAEAGEDPLERTPPVDGFEDIRRGSETDHRDLQEGDNRPEP
jgi:hypothetical protein